jgi:hypothetical protein
MNKFFKNSGQNDVPSRKERGERPKEKFCLLLIEFLSTSTRERGSIDRHIEHMLATIRR